MISREENERACLPVSPFPLPCRECTGLNSGPMCVAIINTFKKKRKSSKDQQAGNRPFSLWRPPFDCLLALHTDDHDPVDAVLNARNVLGNGPADMQMSAGFWLTWFDRPLAITPHMPLNCSSFVQMDQRLSSSIWCSAVSRPLATTRWYVQDINLAHYPNGGRLQVRFMQPSMLGDIVKIIPPSISKANRNTVTL